MAMNQPHSQQDTSAWVFQAWAAFLIAFGTTMVGILYLPVDRWVRGFLAMGVLFTINACFTLAKTVRDNHEAVKFVNRLSGAKAEKLLQEFEGRSPLA
jgi:hypothetical protein